MKLLKRVLAWTLTLTMALSLLGAPAAMAQELSDDAQESAQEEKQVIGTVTGFGELEQDTIAMVERKSLGELLSQMPETLGVYLDGSTELTQIPVSWYCPGGYEDSNDFYFQFSPTWDEDSYPLMEGVDVELDAPYVAVYLADVSAVNVMGTLPDADASKRAVAPGSADEIFSFLTAEFGMNSAAACGILANMHAESALNPRSSCKDINGKTSYGLCQWNDGRFKRLQSWCKENGEDYTTIAGQLRFLSDELVNSYPQTYTHLMNVEDTEEGAYDAAHYWCYYYEQPASRGKRSKERGNLARNSYWPNYGGAAVELTQSEIPVLTGVTTPEITRKKGEVFHLSGSIQCGRNMTQVIVEVCDEQGQRVTGVTAEPNARFFALAGVDSDVKFSKLEPGAYTYHIQASCGEEVHTLLEHAFSVTGEEDAAAPVRKKLRDEDVTVIGGEKALPSVEVRSDGALLTEGQDYKLSFKPGKESGTGLCVVIGLGNYAGKVKKSFKTELDLTESAQQEEPAQTETPAQQEDSDQSQQSAPAAQEDAPVLTDAAVPGEELPQGNFITVRGTVTAPFTLSAVTARVLREDGTEATGGTAKAKGKSCNLNKLDKKVGFSKLTPGRYTYEITAQGQGQTYALMQYPFVVTPRAPSGVKLSQGTGRITVRWSKSEGAEGYEVEYARDADFTDAQTVNVTGKLRKKLTGLEAQQRYFVRVRSYVKHSDDALAYSDYSAAANAETK